MTSTLRAVLERIVVLSLLGCGHGGRTLPTGGGCKDHDVSKEIGPELDDKLKELLASCVDDVTCRPVCVELLQRDTQRDENLVHKCHVYKTGVTTASVTLSWGYSCPGRRPRALATARFDAVTGEAAWLAQQGRLEAASVVAFDELAGELAAHGAPARLVRACKRAARDEARHARLCGAAPTAVTARRGRRSLEAIAIDNAVEGEVRETWGAVTALWQARTARARNIRHAMRAIAPDEVRHAELSAELGRFYASRLPAPARARVAAAKAGAIAEIAGAVAEPVPAALVARLGLPPPEAAARLVAGLRSTIWA